MSIYYVGSNYNDNQHVQGGLFQKSLQWTGPNGIVGAKTGFTFLALIFVTRMRLKPQDTQSSWFKRIRTILKWDTENGEPWPGFE